MVNNYEHTQKKLQAKRTGVLIHLSLKLRSTPTKTQSSSSPSLLLLRWTILLRSQQHHAHQLNRNQNQNQKKSQQHNLMRLQTLSKSDEHMGLSLHPSLRSPPGKGTRDNVLYMLLLCWRVRPVICYEDSSCPVTKWSQSYQNISPTKNFNIRPKININW